jgi:quinolinate synthase
VAADRELLIVAGHVVNRVEVDADTTRLARIALDRMLSVR